MPTARELIKTIEMMASRYPTGLETHMAMSLWVPDDVASMIQDNLLDDRKFSENDIACILDGISQHHDASVGINWSVIESAISNYQIPDPLEQLMDAAKGQQE